MPLAKIEPDIVISSYSMSLQSVCNNDANASARLCAIRVL